MLQLAMNRQVVSARGSLSIELRPAHPSHLLVVVRANAGNQNLRIGVSSVFPSVIGPLTKLQLLLQ